MSDLPMRQAFSLELFEKQRSQSGELKMLRFSGKYPNKPCANVPTTICYAVDLQNAGPRDPPVTQEAIKSTKE